MKQLVLKMAKHKGKGRYRFQVIPVQNQIALTTATEGLVVKTNISTLVQECYAISADLNWAIRGHTAGEGPITVGLSNSQLTVAEIAEALDASPTSEADIVAREQARRPVRAVGVFPGLLSEETLKDGLMIRTPLRMSLAGDLEIAAWARNQSGATLTTGTVVEVNGKIYLKWR